MPTLRQTKSLPDPSLRVTPQEIKKALIDADLTVGELAQLIGKSRSAVSLGINHPSVVPAVRKTILKTLNLQHA